MDRKDGVNPLYFMSETADLYFVRHGNISPIRWVKEFCGTKTKLLFNRKDLAPAFYKLLYRS